MDAVQPGKVKVRPTTQLDGPGRQTIPMSDMQWATMAAGESSLTHPLRMWHCHGGCHRQPWAGLRRNTGISEIVGLVDSIHRVASCCHCRSERNRGRNANYDDAMRRLQNAFCEGTDRNVSLVDELLAERRMDALREVRC